MKGSLYIAELFNSSAVCQSNAKLFLGKKLVAETHNM